MPCSNTLKGFRHRHVNPKTGLRSITFSRSEALHPVEEIEFPCGQCSFCRIKHARDWGIRVALESNLYDSNCFLTLTYDPKYLPIKKTKSLNIPYLDYDAPVLFMKKLRERYSGATIRSFGCAEYGEKFSRPHFHICLLNFDFSDKKILKKSKANFGKNSRENYIYSSEELSELWPEGHSSIGSLTLESASYVARYCTKKISGTRATAHYEIVDPVSGEVFSRPPERSIALSRGRSETRGLGFPWYEKYGKFVRDRDYVVVEGRKHPPPKYFDKLTEEIDPDRFEEIKKKRRLDGTRSNDALNHESHKNYLENPYSRHRLWVIEDVQKLSFKRLQRSIENG